MAQKMNLTANERQFLTDLHALPGAVQAAFRGWLARCMGELKTVGAISPATWSELYCIG